jgi:DnaJ-class molecular chaperone
MSYDAIEDARAAFFKKKRETTPCSFCHSTGFVGTNLCQECRSSGVKDV